MFVFMGCRCCTTVCGLPFSPPDQLTFTVISQTGSGASNWPNGTVKTLDYCGLDTSQPGLEIHIWETSSVPAGCCSYLQYRMEYNPGLGIVRGTFDVYDTSCVYSTNCAAVLGTLRNLTSNDRSLSCSGTPAYDPDTWFPHNLSYTNSTVSTNSCSGAGFGAGFTAEIDVAP